MGEKSKAGRVFHIVQYENNPVTGESLNFSEDNILKGLEHKTIKQHAYILHDKDTYSEEEEKKHIKTLMLEYDDRRNTVSLTEAEWIKQGQRFKAGDKKPKHWHVVLNVPGGCKVKDIAKWFGVPEQYVQVPPGHKGGLSTFLENVKYLDHSDPAQQAKGKYPYKPEEVKANFDWQKEIADAEAQILAFGKVLSVKDKLRYEVQYHGMTLKQAKELDPIGAMNDMDYLKKCRKSFLSEYAQPPAFRINFYIEGKGGYGKGILSKAIARTIIDPEGKMDDKEIFHSVSDGKVSFEKYDGQPVIIWNDFRAYDLIEALGNRGNAFNVLDPRETDITQNVKYDSVRLINSINIINSVQPWSEFFNSLVGEYTKKNGEKAKVEDKGQIRRFPLFIVLDAGFYQIGKNEGVFQGNKELNSVMTLLPEKYPNRFEEIAKACGENFALRDRLMGQAVVPIVSSYKEVYDIFNAIQKEKEEDILKRFSDLGKPIVDSNTKNEQMEDESTQMDMSQYLVCSDELPFD